MNSLSYPSDKASRIIYRAGGITAIIFILYSIASILIMALIKDGYPKTAVECFEMLNGSRFVALLRLDIVSVIVLPLYYILFYSLFQALKNDNELLAKISLFCTLAGVTIFLSSINISSILILGDKYNHATSPEIKQQLLAAGEGMLASDMWVNTASITRAILIESGAVLFSLIMLKTSVFNKATGWTGILTHGFDLSSVLIGIFFPAIKNIFIMIAGPLYIVWFVLLSIRLIQLGKKPEIK